PSQPSPRPHLLRPGTPTYAGGRGGVPRGETVKRTRGSRGRQPPCGGLGANPPRPKESVDRHSSEDFRCRLACEDREMRSASTPSPELRFSVNWASSASGRERCERNATQTVRGWKNHWRLDLGLRSG